MFCHYCGTNLPDGAGFCTHCGKSLGAAAPVQQPAYPAGMDMPSSWSSDIFKSRISVMVTKVLAGLLVVLGIILIIVGLVRDDRYYRSSDMWAYIASGIMCMLFSVPQFMLANMADDLHQMSWRMDHFFKADRDRKKAELLCLQSIDAKLSAPAAGPAKENGNYTPPISGNDVTDKTSEWD